MGMGMGMGRKVEKDVWYPHPPARVCMALTDRDALARWLMPNDFEPRVGCEFTMRTKPAPGFDGVVRCEVLELEEPRVMSWRWRGGGSTRWCGSSSRRSGRGRGCGWCSRGSKGCGGG